LIEIFKFLDNYMIDVDGSALIKEIQSAKYPRDMLGYGAHPPQANWPNQARIAVQFVLNYEEGGESHVAHGDAGSEQFLSEIIGAASFPDRHLSMDSIYEYGSRVGFWRIHHEFARRGLPLTVFGVAMALARNPEVVEAIKQQNYDVVSHGMRWLHYQNVDIQTERLHMAQSLAVLQSLFGTAPMGWYTGRDSPRTRQLLAEFDQIQYDSDYYGDDLPFWTTITNAAGATRPHLIVPYTLDTNDMKFASPAGFNHADQFYHYLKDAFDVLYAEGNTSPKLLSIGMHCRILGRPARFKALQHFLDYVQKHEHVWVCRRNDIAQHWYAQHPYSPKA
jgi:allantoinase